MAGTSLWQIQAQHGGLHSCQGIQSEEPPDHPQAGQADLGSAHVREEPQEGAGDGATDPKQTRVEGIRMSSGWRVSRVSLSRSQISLGKIQIENSTFENFPIYFFIFELKGEIQ